LLNTSQQIGGALGVAIASTVAFTHVNTLLASGHTRVEALTSGFALSFWVLGGLGVASVLAALLLVRSSEVSMEAEGAYAG